MTKQIALGYRVFYYKTRKAAENKLRQLRRQHYSASLSQTESGYKVAGNFSAYKSIKKNSSNTVPQFMRLL